ncbi:hypothetical protein AOLI_G00267510 [Acnodon oligacanthus]
MNNREILQPAVFIMKLLIKLDSIDLDCDQSEGNQSWPRSPGATSAPQLQAMSMEMWAEFWNSWPERLCARPSLSGIRTNMGLH